jgi:Flp pilus assembly protein TadG
MTIDHDDERGSAIIEFIFIAILVMVPLMYLIVAVAVVQRGQLAVTNAARDVGRAVATSSSASDASDRAAAALRISLIGQPGLASQVQLRYVDAGSNCDAATIEPSLAPGSNFAVCVATRQSLPAIPNVLAGRGVTLIGRYVVHMDDFAVGAS